MSLQKRIRASFSIAICILAGIFGILFLTYNIRQYQNQSIAYCRQIVSTNISAVDTYLQTLENYALMLAHDDDIINAVNYRETNNPVYYSVELFQQRSISDKLKRTGVVDGISNTMIIGNSGGYFYYGEYSPDMEYNFLNQAWYLDALSVQSNTVWIGPHAVDYLLSKKGITLSLITRIPKPEFADLTAKYSFLLCDFSLDGILSEVENNNVAICIFNGNEIVHLPDNLTLTDKQLEMLYSYSNSYEQGFILKGKTADKSYVGATVKSRVTGWTIIGLQSMGTINSIEISNFIFALVMIAFSSIVGIFLASLLSKSITKPIELLSESISGINETEDLKSDICKTGSPEIDMIGTAVQEMNGRIVNLNEQLLKDEKRLAEEQLKVMQHQINPHFLNNVLQSVKSLALEDNSEGVSRMVTLLGKVLSYSVYSPYKIVPLCDEIEYIKNYVQIQNIRYSRKIRFEVMCNDDTLKLGLPKMTLQPIVENAIEHGLKQRETGTISIFSYIESGEYIICISNDGIDIEEEKLLMLNNMLESGNLYESTDSIGLLSVKKRLSVYYGYADIHVLSVCGKNTNVVITIPVERIADSNAESSNN